MDPSDADVAGNLGMAYAMTGDMPAAIATLEEVVDLDPDLADGRVQLGVLYF